MTKFTDRTRRRVGLLAAFGLIGGLVALTATIHRRSTDHGPDSSGGPLAARRLTQEQYKAIVSDVFGADIEIGGRFEPDIRRSGLLAVGASDVTVTPSGFEQYDSMARTIAAQVVDAKHRAALVGCVPAAANAPDEACARIFFSQVGRLLFRRPLNEEELQAQLTVAAATTRKLGDFYSGVATGLTTMLDASPFLFRLEAAEPDPDHPGERRLNAFSKASRLSFFFWNTTPDDELLKAAEEGELNSDRGLVRQVDRLMASSRLEGGVRAFFSDMLGFDGFSDLAKDSVVYPKFSTAVLADAQEQTLRTITDHVLIQHADYRDLFTTRKIFLNRLLGMIYQVPIPAQEGWEAYEFPKDDSRSGLLTQVSFLALHSHPGRSSPTIRGKALREILLCQKVPDPPANVNFKLVQDTKNPNYKTARERLTAHRSEPTCAGCHKMIDPMGLSLENFDSIGGYRATENGARIDASGELDGVKFTNAAGLGQAMHDNPAVPACLVTRLSTYAAGRPATPGEAEWVKYLQAGFAADGYRLPELMRRIATSSGFYRVSTSQTVASAR
jgi:hypothetical protein